MSVIDDISINAQMLVHVPLCTHKEPKEVLILSENQEIKSQIDKYEEMNFQVVDKDFVKALESADDEAFDVVILDATPSSQLVAQLNRITKNDGLVVSQAGEKKESMQSFGSLFRVVMPYRYTNTKAFEEVVLASKKYHPTADIILQRSDLLEDVSYYNTEVHLASFALPTYERKNLAGIYKQ